MREFFKADGVSGKSINDFFKRCYSEDNEIHAIQIYSGGKLTLRASQHPYKCEDKGELYSLSKTFTSTSVGILVDKGLLSVEEKIVNIFPDKCPENISENLSKMTVKHVLTMNTGHSGCVMETMYKSEDAVKAFLKNEVKFTPGTHFAYNTGATCLLSAIIKKITGMPLFEFANENLFKPLSITNASWNRTDDKTTEGGIGLQVSCDDILKLGIMYLNKGVYNNKRIVSEAWIKEASTPWSDNNDNGNPDWCAGYGYQIWINARGGFRGDGAFGQLCVVLPERDTVVTVVARCRDMQTEIDAIIELLENLNQKEDEPVLDWQFETLGKTEKKEFPFMNKMIKLKENIIGFTRVYIEYEGNSLAIRFSDGRSEKTILSGNGEYAFSSYTASWRKPKLLGLMHAKESEMIHTASSYKIEDEKIIVKSRFLNSPNSEEINIYEKDGKLHIEFISDMLEDEAKLLIEE